MSREEIALMLFAYQIMAEGMFTNNSHWIRQAAQISALEVLDEVAIYRRLSDAIYQNIDEYVSHNGVDFNLPIEFRYEHSRHAKPTGKYVNYSVNFNPTRNCELLKINDELNPNHQIAIEFPHVVGSLEKYSVE